MRDVMVLEIEGKNPIAPVDEKTIVRQLRRLRSHGPSSYAILQSRAGDYVQVAGGGVTCMLERRESEAGKHYRAWQDPPIVPFEDGTILAVSSGDIPLQRGEWFTIDQVIQTFAAFLRGESLPSYIHWKDISEILK